MVEGDEEAENIFREGVLCVVNIAVWGGRIRLPQSCYQVEADKDMTAAIKYLIDKEVLRPVHAVRAEARTLLFDNSLPFPITGAKFIPKKLIPLVDKRLKEIQAKFEERVEDFCKNYDTFMNDAKGTLKGLYNASEYPVNIREKFAFEYRYIIISNPKEGTMLPPEIYEQEQAKFTNMLQDFRTNAVDALRTKFAEMVEGIVERLTDEHKSFKDSSIKNVQDFLTDFEDLNINNDTELEANVKKVMAILEGADAKVIRSDKELRGKIAKSMVAVKDDLITRMAIRPHRKIRVAGKGKKEEVKDQATAGAQADGDAPDTIGGDD